MDNKDEEREMDGWSILDPNPNLVDVGRKKDDLDLALLACTTLVA